MREVSRSTYMSTNLLQKRGAGDSYANDGLSVVKLQDCICTDRDQCFLAATMDPKVVHGSDDGAKAAGLGGN